MHRAGLTKELEVSGIVLSDRHRQLATQINREAALFPDFLALGSIYESSRAQPNEGNWLVTWREALNSIPASDRRTIQHAVGSIVRSMHYPGIKLSTLGDLREVSVADLLTIRHVGPIQAGMGKLLFARDLALSKDQLMHPNEVRELVQKGRVPIIEHRTCIIPPRGANIFEGGIARLPFGAYEFTSSRGELIGYGRIFELSRVEVGFIKYRRDAALRDLLTMPGSSIGNIPTSA